MTDARDEVAGGLSLDAKALAGCLWGSPIGLKTQLSYKRAHDPPRAHVGGGEVSELARSTLAAAKPLRVIA